MKKKFKKFFQKSLSVLMVVGIFMSSFSGITLKIPEVHAMSGVSGDKIIEVAQSYKNAGYGYWNVGTCTGFVTRVLNKLNIGHSVVGTHPYNIDQPQPEGTGAKYAPSAMYRNAMNHPEDAQLIFQGYVKDLIKRPEILKNGDLALQRPEDKVNYSGLGHAGFIHLYGNTISWLGANGEKLGISDVILVEDSTTGGGHKDINGEDYITVFRLTKSEPEYAKTSATKSADERVEVSFRKTDAETGKVLEGVEVDFYRDDVKFASGVTDSTGIARATSTNTFTATSEEKEYVTNYDELDDEGRQKVDERGAFHYLADAQASADVEAQREATTLASQKHTFSVVETKTKTKYWLDESNKTVSDSIEGSGSISLSLTNERVTATATLKKVDYDTKGKAQNEATLEDAVYGLFAKNNILDPADAEIIHRAGDEVFRGRIKNGEITVTDLYLGDYEWREITPSEGYTLSPISYDVRLEYAGQTVNTVLAKTTATEKVITGNFEIEKVITSGEESEITEKEEGAEFIAVAEKYVIKYGSIEEAWEHRDEFTEKEYDHLITDSNGYAKSRDLAYGKIRIKQIKGKLDTEKVKDEWTFTVSKENQETIKYIVNNTIFKSYVKLVKKDLETGKMITLSNTTFKILDLSTNEILKQKVGKDTFEEWTTSSDGTFVLPLEVQAGRYKLLEVKSPDLYLVNNEGVEFSVTTSNIIETDSDGDAILTVEMLDQSVKGQINVEKHGEVLTGIEQDENGNYNFVYEEKCVAGMMVEIKAREDIIDPADGSVLYEKGTIIDSIKTGNTCDNKSILLPLGKYTVYEVETPEGMVIDTKEYDVDLTFKDEVTPVVMETVSITNKRQKVELDIIKLNKDSKTPIKGAFFGLYAIKDIVLPETDTILIKEGTLIESVYSDEDGNLPFKADLPLSFDKDTYFEIREVKELEGYYPSEETISVDTEYKGQKEEIVKDASLEEILTTIQKKDYSKTPIMDAGLSFKIKWFNEEEYMEAIASLDSLICNLAAFLSVEVVDDLTYVSGYTATEAGPILAQGAHAWGMLEDGQIIDVTPSTMSLEEKKEGQQIIENILLFGVQNKIPILGISFLIGAALNKKFRKKIKVSLKIQQVKKVLETEEIEKAYAQINEVLYGGVCAPRKRDKEAWISTIEREFSSFDLHDLRILKKEIQVNIENETTRKNAEKLLDVIPYIKENTEEIQKKILLKKK